MERGAGRVVSNREVGVGRRNLRVNRGNKNMKKRCRGRWGEPAKLHKKKKKEEKNNRKSSMYQACPKYDPYLSGRQTNTFSTLEREGRHVRATCQMRALSLHRSANADR